MLIKQNENTTANNRRKKNPDTLERQKKKNDLTTLNVFAIFFS